MTTGSFRHCLSGEEISTLRGIINKGRHLARVNTRARILLCAHEGLGTRATALELDVNRSTVKDIRRRYTKAGLDHALYDSPRSGRPRKLTDAIEAKLVATACSASPEGHGWWTMEMLRTELVRTAELDSIGVVTLWRALDKRGIKPWREKNVVHPTPHA